MVFDDYMLPSTHSMSSEAYAESLECLNYQFEEDEFPFSRDLACVVDETYKYQREGSVGVDAEETTQSKVHEHPKPIQCAQQLPVIQEESVQEPSGSSSASLPHLPQLLSTLKPEECLMEETEPNEGSFFSSDLKEATPTKRSYKTRKDVVLKTLLRSIRRFLNQQLCQVASIRTTPGQDLNYIPSDSDLLHSILNWTTDLTQVIIHLFQTNTQESLTSDEKTEFHKRFLGFLLMLNMKVITGHRNEKIKGRPMFNKYRDAIEKFSELRMKRLAANKQFSILLRALESSKEFKKFVSEDVSLKHDQDLYLKALRYIIKL